MNRDDIIRMAREAGLESIYSAYDEPGVRYAYEDWDEELERFAALVYAEGHKDGLDDFEAGVLPAAIAAEREKVAAWMNQHGYATGHGETTEDLLAELEWQIAENWTRALIKGVEGEREACIEAARTVGGDAGAEVEKLIRARGQG